MLPSTSGWVTGAAKSSLLREVFCVFYVELMSTAGTANQYYHSMPAAGYNASSQQKTFTVASVGTTTYYLQGNASGCSSATVTVCFMGQQSSGCDFVNCAIIAPWKAQGRRGGMHGLRCGGDGDGS